MTRYPLLVPSLAAVALAALVGMPFTPPSALGQTIPLRPTATAEAGAFAAVAQPTPPPAPSPARPAAVVPAPTGAPSPQSATPEPTPVATSAAPGLVGYRLEHVTLAAASVPPPPAGWRLGGSALRVSGTPPPSAPASVAVLVSARDLASAGGIQSGLAIFALDAAGQWIRVAGQSPDSAGRLTFIPSGPGIYAVLARELLDETGDYPVAGGRFFRTGPTGGFSVLDGAGGPRAAFWTVYAALGGESALGLPLSRRFEADGQLLQVFERGVIASDTRTSATARLGATAPRIPSGALEPEPPPLPAKLPG